MTSIKFDHWPIHLANDKISMPGGVPFFSDADIINYASFNRWLKLYKVLYPLKLFIMIFPLIIKHLTILYISK